VSGCGKKKLSAYGEGGKKKKKETDVVRGGGKRKATATLGKEYEPPRKKAALCGPQ